MRRRPKEREEARRALNAREEILSFFSCVLERRFSEAERLLRVIGEKGIGGGEFKEGYLNALGGIYLSLRTGDQRDFINKVLADADLLAEYEKAFRARARDYTRTPYDSGYFSAWSDFIRYYISVGRRGKAPASD